MLNRRRSRRGTTTTSQGIRQAWEGGEGTREESLSPASPTRRYEAFDINLDDTAQSDVQSGDQSRRPPRRLKKLESVTSPLTSEELKRKQEEVDGRRAAELERKRETGRKHTRRDRFRKEVEQARLTCDADNENASNGQIVPSGDATVEDKLAKDLPGDSADEMQVAEFEKDSSQVWDNGSDNKAGAQDSAEEW